ncbi:hypothetical protein [Streptomyces sp. BRA346]|uniref:hypothetical protein n=1 Tax=Streptomyces sp. BRA346 TaxID=2878199 RepID=UPI0040642F34
MRHTRPAQRSDVTVDQPQETLQARWQAVEPYNLVWYVEACLSNALRMETCIQDAEREKDTEVAELFRKAQADSRKGAELGKQLLKKRIAS